LTATTDSVAEAFHTQLDRMVWQLDRYNQQFRTLKDQDLFPTEPDSKAWLARVSLPDPCKDSQDKPLPFCYPNFSVVFWADGEGILRESWTQAATPYVRGTHNLRQRDYVTKVQASAKHLHRRLIDNRWLEFYAQPLISLESSTRSLVVSMPSRASSEETTHAMPWVAAIQSEDFSLLKDPVLPPGTGYAVIEDQTGLALFHSNGRRMLRENFLEETDNNPEIAALIHARAEGGVEGDYWGSGHRFSIKPLSGLPWTLVVFESKEAFRTTNFEALLFSLSLFTLYILAILLWMKALTLTYRFDASGQRVRWTWPKQGLRHAYHWLSLLQIGVVGLGLAAVFGMDWQQEMSPSSRLTLAGLPFLTMWVVVRTLWKGQSNLRTENPEHGGDHWALLQTSQLIGTFTRFGLTTFLLLGVFPAILFFKVAHDQEMRLFAQHDLWGFGQSLAQQTEGPWLAKGRGESRRDVQFLTSPTNCLIVGCLTGREAPPLMKSAACSPWSRASATPDLQYSLQAVFPSFPLATCLSFDAKSWNPKEAIRASWIDRLHQLIRKSSLQNPMNKESWGFLHPTSADTTASWTQHITDGYQQVMLRLNDFPQGTGKAATFGPLYLSLWTPLFPWNLSARLPGLLVIAGLLLVIGYFILRYMVTKIYAFPSFFHRSHETGAAPLSPQPSVLEHLLVVGPPGSGKSFLAVTLGPDCPVLDMHGTYGKDTWAESLASSLPEQTTAVVLDHFEYQWEDPAHRKETGVLVERLLARGLKVCIFSTRDPLEWTRSQVSGQIEPDQDATQAYWIDLLGSFGFTHFTPSRMEALLQEWLHPQTEHVNAAGPTLPVKHCLQQESLPTVHLERIGNWIRGYQEWATWTPGQMKEQFLHIGWPYYQALWQSCSLTEKLALYHIAVDGYVHGDNPDLTSLSQKGLIRLTPDLQIMNDSFRNCVLQLGTNFQLSKWEKQIRPDTWGQMKWPFLFIFGTILLFFFFTQQEFKNSFITLMSLLPILLPALPELPTLLTGSKNTQGSSG
ncbi:MAG: cache domain-containing protein, partial [Nitrospirota bacterium]|nr:cache domain-containing protein [Nitrospirota bacterium]